VLGYSLHTHIFVKGKCITDGETLLDSNSNYTVYLYTRYLGGVLRIHLYWVWCLV